MEDHYQILGLPSGTEGSKLTTGEIRKAYRARALACHPDKRPDDPLAAANFQKIQTSYEVLIDETARKALDDFLRVRQERLDREYGIGSKRRKMMDDLRGREKAFDLQQQRYQNDAAEEEKAAKKLREEISRIRAMHAKKKFNSFPMPFNPPPKSEQKAHCGEGSDKEKMLKVTWNCPNGGGDYSAERLREIFAEFGTVEDIVIRHKGSKKKGSAIIVMASKSEVASAAQSLCGDLSNPLLVLPLLPSTTSSGYRHEESQADADDADLKNIVGAGYQAYEDSILKKLQKAAEKARLNHQGQQ